MQGTIQFDSDTVVRGVWNEGGDSLVLEFEQAGDRLRLDVTEIWEAITHIIWCMDLDAHGGENEECA
jgi:hypothetical protein